jgi:deoxycytidylate deaminase
MIVRAEIAEIVFDREYKSEYTKILLEKAGIKIKKWNKVNNFY